MSDGNIKVAGPTLKTTRGILLYKIVGEGGLPGDRLTRESWLTGSVRTRLCWTSRGGRDLMSRLKLRKADLFGHGRFWIGVRS